jgi:hypothetical protein
MALSWGDHPGRRVLTHSGLVSCYGGRSAGGIEQVQPFILAVPAVGQVKGDVAAAVAGSDGQSKTPDGG